MKKENNPGYNQTSDENVSQKRCKTENRFMPDRAPASQNSERPEGNARRVDFHTSLFAFFAPLREYFLEGFYPITSNFVY